MDASAHFSESGTSDNFLELQKALSAASEADKNKLRARYAGKEGSAVEASQEKGIETSEQEKFDELMEAVNKFEELAKETKNIEKELQEAERAHDEHYSSYAGKITLADQNRERGLVTLRAEVGQKLEEMIVLKGDILDKLSDIKSHELRAKTYERFERKKPDEVGMSSEVKLETKSDKHTDDLKHRTLNHKAREIVKSNLEKIAKKKTEAEKIVVEVAPENVEPSVQEETAVANDLKEEEIRNNSEDHLAPGIQIGREEESETPKPEEVQTKSPKDIIEQKAVIDIPEQKPQPVAENKSEIKDKPSEPPVEIMEIGPDGDPVSVTDNEGDFREDEITFVDGSAQQNIPQSKVGESEKQKVDSSEFIDKIREKQSEIAERMGLELKKPVAEPIRKIDDFLPPTSRIEQAAETIEQDLNKPIAAAKAEPIIDEKTVSSIPVIPEKSGIQDSDRLVDSRLRGNDNVEGGNDNAKMAESDDQILTQNIQTAEPVVPEQKIEPVQPVTEEVGNNDAGNMIDIKPAIEAKEIQLEQPLPEQKRGFFGRIFGGNNADRHGAEVIAGKGDELTADHIHQILGANEEKEAA
ncbi:MAG: hypothetical protein WC536_03765 [Patescibacteria group bacterium]